MTGLNYGEPVAKLLSLGQVAEGLHSTEWADYRALGLDTEDVPELIRMASDVTLNHADGNSAEVWAPLHAWRALGQLQAVEAAAPLLRLLDKLSDDIWLPTELRDVFSLIGPAAIPVLAEFLGDEDVREFTRNPVPEYLQQIARDHPECREECIALLTRQLERYETNDRELNAFLIWSLMELRETKAIGLIRRAFASDRVEMSIVGDLEEVEIDMGLRKLRLTPRPNFSPFAHAMDELELDPLPTFAPARNSMKVGRNDPCPCGSGRKFKKCCLR